LGSRGKTLLSLLLIVLIFAGAASKPEAFTASAFNSGIASALAQNFQLQAEPANNNTAWPSGTLNLLYAAGTAPAETGLSNKGVITFATGWTFSGGGALCVARDRSIRSGTQRKARLHSTGRVADRGPFISQVASWLSGQKENGTTVLLRASLLLTTFGECHLPELATRLEVD
jgi:hypothetical protein